MRDKKYIVRAQRKDDGRYVDANTNNPTHRIKKLKEDIGAVNGKPGRVFDRFNIFEGCDPETDVIFTVFKEV